MDASSSHAHRALRSGFDSLCSLHHSKVSVAGTTCRSRKALSFSLILNKADDILVPARRQLAITSPADADRVINWSSTPVACRRCSPPEPRPRARGQSERANVAAFQIPQQGNKRKRPEASRHVGLNVLAARARGGRSATRPGNPDRHVRAAATAWFGSRRSRRIMTGTRPAVSTVGASFVMGGTAVVAGVARAIPCLFVRFAGMCAAFRSAFAICVVWDERGGASPPCV
jgi:hypothetical protein